MWGLGGPQAQMMLPQMNMQATPFGMPAGGDNGTMLNYPGNLAALGQLMSYIQQVQQQNQQRKTPPQAPQPVNTPSNMLGPIVQDRAQLGPMPRGADMTPEMRTQYRNLGYMGF